MGVLYATYWLKIVVLFEGRVNLISYLSIIIHN